MHSKRLSTLGTVVAIAAAAGVGHIPAMTELKAPEDTYSTRKRKRGHWQNDFGNRKPFKVRAASKRARHARRVHRK